MSEITREERLQIARQYYEERRSQKEISTDFKVSNKEISRILRNTFGKEWVVKVEPKEEKVADRDLIATVVAAALRNRPDFRLFGVVVVRTSGVEDAFSDNYLSQDDATRERAYEASDELHKQLAEAAVPILVDKCLNPDYSIGVGSGRGVMYSALKIKEFIEENKLKTPVGFRVLSLHGGYWVRAWSEKATKKLPTHIDADEVAFQLNSALKLAEDDITYRHSMIAVSDTNTRLGLLQNFIQRVKARKLDVCLLGIGVVNSGHSLFRSGESQVQYIAKELDTIKQAQGSPNDSTSSPRIGKSSLADIGHQFFWLHDLPEGNDDLKGAVNSINSKLVTPAEIIQESRSVILVAGGAQKYPAIYGLAYGETLSLPVKPEVTTLITDENTAKKLIEKVTPSYQ